MLRTGLLFTNKGLLRVDEIGSVFAPSNVLLQKDVNLIPDSLVTGFEQFGVQDVICLRTKDSIEICVTEETEILIESKESPIFVQTKDVRVEDRLIITTDKCSNTLEGKFCSAEYGMDKIEPLQLTDDLITLVANYCYSGTMFGSRVRFYISQKDRDSVMRALEVLKVQDVMDFNGEISFTNELFCRWLVNNRICDVPYVVRTSSKRVIMKFLAGVEQQTFISIHNESSAFVQQTLALYRYVGYLMRFEGKFSVRDKDSGNFDSDEVVSKTKFTDYAFSPVSSSEILFLSGAVIR